MLGLYQGYGCTLYQPTQSASHPSELPYRNVPSKKDVPAEMCSKNASRYGHMCSWGLRQDGQTHSISLLGKTMMNVSKSVSGDNSSLLCVSRSVCTMSDSLQPQEL